MKVEVSLDHVLMGYLGTLKNILTIQQLVASAFNDYDKILASAKCIKCFYFHQPKVFNYSHYNATVKILLCKSTN